MLKNLRYISTLITVTLLIITMITVPVVRAGESSPATGQPDLFQKDVPVAPVVKKETITLEQAIQIVKTNFEVPDELTEFNSGYNYSEDRQAWFLNWNNPNGRGGEFSANVDAVSGDILNMFYWKYPEQTGGKTIIPGISKARAQEISNDLLKRLLGERAGELHLKSSDNQIVPLVEYGPLNYSMQYERQVNGVLFLENSAHVEVSGIDGHIVSYSLNWSDVELPDPKGAINTGQAFDAFLKAPLFKLQYWIPSFDPLLSKGQKQEAKLVYRLTGQNGGAIDAFTGNPLQLNPGEWLVSFESGYDGMGSAAIGSTVKDQAMLTPQEQQEIAKTTTLLSRDEAIAAVKCWLEIPANMVLRSASLVSNWQDRQNRIWAFDWSTPEQINMEGKYQYLSAQINAATGELTGFNKNYEPSGKTGTQLDRAAAQKPAEEFLKKVQPERFNQVVLTTENSNDIYSKPGMTEIQNFCYCRIVNGVDFADNGMTVTVNTADGTIIAYQLNWSEAALPAVSRIISKDQAVGSFLQGCPLTLTYVRIFADGKPGPVKLVYLPLVQDSGSQYSNIVDAKTGELIDYLGQPLGKAPKPYYFTDLAGVEGKEEIATLGQAGLFGDFGSIFKPEEKMKVASLLRAMYYCRYGVWRNTSLTDEEIVSKARELGWIKEDVQAGDNVSRELLARLLIYYINLNKLAELPNTYQVNYSDASEINPGNLGYIALACSTGILKVDGLQLAPREEVSRAEAASAFLRALGWRN